MTRKTANPKKQLFRFTAPGVESVLLVGDFTHWQQEGIPMKKGKSGVWEVSLALPAGQYHYRFIVDKEWKDDPECRLRVQNPFGGENMVRHVT